MGSEQQVITINTIIDGVEYKPRPGLAYEIADGIQGKMRRHTPARLERVEQIAEALRKEDGEKHVTDIIVEQAKVVLDAPASFNWSREEVDSTVCQIAVADFLAGAYPSNRLVRTSSGASVPGSGLQSPETAPAPAAG